MKTNNKLHYYIYTLCRYFSATMIMIYAFAKIIGTQFSSSLITYDTPLIELDPMELLWYFYGYSYKYSFFIASIQIITGLLLFFRKTVRLGSISLLILMVNIISIDIVFDVDFDAFIMAVILFCMGLFIFLSEFKLFIKYFITEPSLYEKNNVPNFINKVHKIKFIYMITVSIGFFSLLYYINEQDNVKNDFYGVWELQKGNTEYNRIYIEGNHFETVQFNKMKSDKRGWLDFNSKSNSINLKGYSSKYINEINKQKNATVDKTKKEEIFNGNYEINNNILKLKNNKTELIFKKIKYLK